jgi:hypothetical protein
MANATTMEPWWLFSAADVGKPGTSASGMTCPDGQYEDGSGDCHACSFSAPTLWAVLVFGGLIVCGVAWWLGKVALQRMATAKGVGTGVSKGQFVSHGATGAMQVRDATTIFSTTTSSFQFLYLFQVHLTWPVIVIKAWRWLTEFASLAWFRLEFLFDAIKSLCTKQYVPLSATVLAPFIMFAAIYCISKIITNNDKIEAYSADYQDTDNDADDWNWDWYWDAVRRGNWRAAWNWNVDRGRAAWDWWGRWDWRALWRVVQDYIYRRDDDWDAANAEADDDDDDDRRRRRVKAHRVTAAESTGVAVAVYSLLFTMMVSKIAEPILSCSRSASSPLSSRYDNLSCFDWNDSTWTQLAVSSIACGALFVILWPWYLFFTIKAHRKNNYTQDTDDDELFETRYGWLYIRYRSECWFWEFVVMTRKVLFVGIGLIRNEQLLCVMYLVATCLALALQAKLQPFKSKEANHAETSFLLVQTITLALGGVFAFGLIDTSSLLAKLVSFVLILINFYTLYPLLKLAHGSLRNHSNTYHKATARCAKCDGRCIQGNAASEPLLSGAE